MRFRKCVVALLVLCLLAAIPALAEGLEIEEEPILPESEEIGVAVARLTHRLLQFPDADAGILAQRVVDEAAVLLDRKLVLVADDEDALTLYAAQKTLMNQGVDGIAYRDAVDAEGLTEEKFRDAVAFFVERCRNQKTGN